MAEGCWKIPKTIITNELLDAFANAPREISTKSYSLKLEKNDCIYFCR